jgi:hypothetical protein
LKKEDTHAADFADFRRMKVSNSKICEKIAQSAGKNKAEIAG